MILMLNCSYKEKNGNTQYFLELLKKEIEVLGRSRSNCRENANVQKRGKSLLGDGMQYTE